MNPDSSADPVPIPVPVPAAWHERLVRLVPGLTAADLSLAIHPGDQMYSHSLAHHGQPDIALSQYFAISLQQFSVARQVVRSLFGADAGRLQWLDFACGYGRLLRLLPALVPPAQTWASDIQAPAVAFVERTFGVQGLLSSADPEQFAPAERFDVIWVASLFSHLPGPLFRAWLARLMHLLSPDGVICFSVRDASQLPPGMSLPEGGLLYSGDSENAELDPDIYGTTWASEAYVRQALAGQPYARLPRALANEQDLYIAAANPARDLSALTAIRRGPWGWLDRRRLDADGGLELEGWAGSLDDGQVDRVEIRFGSQARSLACTIDRPDVAHAFADPRMARVGWRCRLPWPGQVSEADAAVSLEVQAVSRQDERIVLYAGRALDETTAAVA
ncbi:MAG: class I SAM-dependent methyltransferase [Xanthomonadales bacterium]|nr:class I SAM-dependent methyltransferase [Xanthomonadales bacterium]